MRWLFSILIIMMGTSIYKRITNSFVHNTMRQRILLSSSSFHKTTTNFYQKKKETSDLECQNTRFLLENPSNPSDVWACLRLIDSFGIQFVDVVINNEEYEGKYGLSRRSTK
mmetsp:Transcript_37116/g.40984  ORF Transcript_37116/g.40984 Transcript_37116/m.40984 type:complete len:112 (-) Transcript_37116:1298-1633(-)